MPTYPTSLSNFGPDEAPNDIIYASHINELRAELIAVEKTLSANDTGTIDPANVIDTLLYAGYAAALTVSGINRVGGALDIIASQLKQIIGDTSWQSVPLITLLQARAPNYIVGSAQANLPNSITLANVNRSGLLSARPAANTVVAGVFYFATDTGQMFRSDAANWVVVSNTPLGTLTSGALLYWNGTSLVSVTPPASTTPVYLQYTNLGYSFNSVPPNYSVLQKPCVYNQSTNEYTFYNTIQEAITAATLDFVEMVLVPPGTYNERLTLKSGIAVIEILSGTVTLTYNGANADATVTIPNTVIGIINVSQITRTNGSGPCLSIPGGYLDHTSRIDFMYRASVASTNTNIVEVSGNAGVQLYNTLFRVSTLSSDTTSTITAVKASAGVVELYNCKFQVYAQPSFGSLVNNDIRVIESTSTNSVIMCYNPLFDLRNVDLTGPVLFQGELWLCHNTSANGTIVVTTPIVVYATKIFLDYCYGLVITESSGSPLIPSAANTRGSNISIQDVQALAGLVAAQQMFI